MAKPLSAKEEKQRDEFRALVAAGDAKKVVAFISKAKPPLTTDELITQAAFGAKTQLVLRDQLFEIALARVKDCAAVHFTRAHAAALTGKMEWLDGATKDDLSEGSHVWNITSPPLTIAAQRGDIVMVKVLIARGAGTKGALDIAVEYGRDAVVELLLASGERPTYRTVGKISASTTDLVIKKLIAAGLDLNDEDAELAAWVGMGDVSTKERVAHARRLIGHGWKLDAAGLVSLLESVHEDTVAEEDIGAQLIDLAHAHGLKPDKKLVELALDRLPVAALDRLVAAGAEIRPDVRVKSKAPDAAKKKKWLEAYEPKAKGGKTSAAAPKKSKRISWEDFARLDGGDLTPALVCERLVADGVVFPEFELGRDPDEQPIASFETSIEDDELPATHTFSADVSSLDYDLRYHMATGTDETFKKHGKAAFDALLKAITALHGKATGSAKSKYWTLDDREIELSHYTESSHRPSAKVTLAVRQPQ